MAKSKSVAWKSLRTAQGPATRVPAQVKQVVSGADDMERRDAYWVLWEGLVGNGQWFDASAPAVALLLETAEKADDPTPLFTLTADILGSNQIRGWLAPADAPLDPLEKAAHEAAVEKQKVLPGALASPSSLVRGAAAMTLAMLPELAAQSIAPLSAMARGDASRVARASAVLALGRVGAHDEATAALLSEARVVEEPADVRGAAGMAALRMNPALPFEDVRAEIEAWLSVRPEPGTELPWFRDTEWTKVLPLADAPARLLCAFTQRRGKAAEDAMIAFASAGAKSSDGTVNTQLAKLLIVLGNFPQESKTGVVFEELSSEQQTVARLIAKGNLLPNGGAGIPAAGRNRRRWAGLEAPGPLDARVPHQGASRPLWRVNYDRALTPTDFDSRLDYWQSVIEIGAWTYPGKGWNLKPEVIETELAALPPGEELFERIVRIADDLAERQVAAVAGGLGARLGIAQSALLLLPWVRAGKPIEPRWDVLVIISQEAHSRELFGALPLERRQALFLGKFAELSWGGVASAVSVVDLVPTRESAAAVYDAIDQLAQKDTLAEPMRKLRERMDGLAKEHPGLAR